MNKLAVTIAAALALGACHKQASMTGEGSGMIVNGDAPYTALEGSGSATVPTTPEFVAKAATSDLFEIESSRIALARSNNAEIRNFASQMIDAHKQTSAALKAIVAKRHLPAPPATLDEDHAKLVSDLKSAKPDEFDKLFLDQQSTAHRDTLSLMQGYASGGDNPDLKAFAGDTAPKVQGHLTMAQGLDKAGVDEGSAKPAV